MENKPNCIIWHHTAHSSDTSQFLQVNNYHKNLGFPKSILGYYGGYHLLIEKDGTARRYRADNEIGAHDKDENINSLGIALAGNFNIERPTKEQELSFVMQLGRAMVRYKIPEERIEPHRIGDNTDCPGKLLPDDWAQQLLPHIEPADCRGMLQEIIKFVEAKLNATHR